MITKEFLTASIMDELAGAYTEQSRVSKRLRSCLLKCSKEGLEALYAVLLCRRGASTWRQIELLNQINGELKSSIDRQIDLNEEQHRMIESLTMEVAELREERDRLTSV